MVQCCSAAANPLSFSHLGALMARLHHPTRAHTPCTHTRQLWNLHLERHQHLSQYPQYPTADTTDNNKQPPTLVKGASPKEPSPQGQPPPSRFDTENKHTQDVLLAEHISDHPHPNMPTTPSALEHTKPQDQQSDVAELRLAPAP